MKTKRLMNVHHAVAIVEGFADFEPTEAEELEAWAYLIKTGYCWQLQGWYGRTAQNYIDAGIIDRHGKIDWHKVL